MAISRILFRSLRELDVNILWPSVVFSAALSLIVYQEVLTVIWPVESLRVELSFLGLFCVFIGLFYWILQHFLLPRFKLLEKPRQNAIIVLSAFIFPLVYAIAMITPHKVAEETIFFLLPTRTIQIEASPATLIGDENVVLTGFDTQAQGHISFDTMELAGWQRSANHLILTDPANNRITWVGKPGQKVTVKFAPRSRPTELYISWDGHKLSEDLFSNTVQEIRTSRKFDIPWYADWVMVSLAGYLSLVFLGLVLFVGLVTFPGLAVRVSPRKALWLHYALPIYLVWAVYLMIFWPGFMSVDSISSWQQIVTGKFVHGNPVPHTLTMWLITRFWFSPAAVAVVQILVLGGVLGWGISALHQQGAPVWLTWLTSIGLALSPANGALSITLWKDILFSAAVVTLTIQIFKIVTTQGEWLDGKAAWLYLGASLLFISSYRLNGFLIASLCIVIIAGLYRTYWRSLVRASCFFLAIYFVVTGPVFQLLNVSYKIMARPELVMANLLAAHMNAGTRISFQDQMILEPIVSEYPWPYKCDRNSDFIFDNTLNRKYLAEHTGEILYTAFKATLQDPGVTLRHFACQGEFVFRIDDRYANDFGVLGITDNVYGLETSSFVPDWVSPWENALNDIAFDKVANINWFVWRMPFWMYASFFGCVTFCLRNKSWRFLLILVPGSITILPYLVISLGQIFRYVYSMYLVGILFSGYFWLCVAAVFDGQKTSRLLEDPPNTLLSTT